MKKLIWLALGVLVLTSACAKKDDGGGSATPSTIALTPNQPCNIPGQTQCDPNYYNQYQQYGWMAPQPYQWSNANGYCGCPQGYVATFNPSWGYGCVLASAMGAGYNNNPYVYWNFQGGFNNNYGNPYYAYGSNYGYPQGYQGQLPPAQNGQWLNIPQNTYQPVISGTGNCSVQAAGACDVRNPNSCGPNAICRVVGGGSTMGLCTSGVGHDYYSSNCHIERRQHYSYWVCGGNQYQWWGGSNGSWGTPR